MVVLLCTTWLPRLHRAGPSTSLDKEDLIGAIQFAARMIPQLGQTVKVKWKRVLKTSVSVILNKVKNLTLVCPRPFAALRVTRWEAFSTPSVELSQPSRSLTPCRTYSQMDVRDQRIA